MDEPRDTSPARRRFQFGVVHLFWATTIVGVLFWLFPVIAKYPWISEWAKVLFTALFIAIGICMTAATFRLAVGSASELFRGSQRGLGWRLLEFFAAVVVSILLSFLALGYLYSAYIEHEHAMGGVGSSVIVSGAVAGIVLFAAMQLVR